jgi:hypothetical protein
MGLVQGLLSIKYTDPIHVPASTPAYIQVDDTNTVADIMTKAQADLLLWKALTDDGIVGFSLDLQADVSAVSTPAADANSEQGLLTNFNQVNSQYASPYWIAGLKDTLIVNGHIDLAAGAIVNWVGMMTTLGGVYEYVSKYHNHLTALRDAAEAFRKLRRRAEKVTKSTP